MPRYYSAMTHNTPPLFNVLMAALPDGDGAPDWVHLLPATQGMVQTNDRRGPYRVRDAQALINASFAESTRLPIDQDHAIDLAAPKGLPAPARGWITQMQARDDGIWGHVEWTDEGRDLVTSRAYQGISPVITHDAGKSMHAVLRASLVNQPNLKGLTALNAQENTVDTDKIAQALGLQAGSDEDAILNAIHAQKQDSAPPALQTALQAAQTERDTAQSAVAALQEQVSELVTSLNARETAEKESRAAAFIDGAMAEKRAGLNAQTREFYLALHMQDPDKTEAAIAQMPILGETNMGETPPSATRSTALNAAQIQISQALGYTSEEYSAQLALMSAQDEGAPQ